MVLLLIANSHTVKNLRRLLEEEKVNFVPPKPTTLSQEVTTRSNARMAKTKLRHPPPTGGMWYLCRMTKLFGYRKLLCKAMLQWEFKFKLPNKDKIYDGTSDLYDHITNYQATMHLHKAMISCIELSPWPWRKRSETSITTSPQNRSRPPINSAKHSSNRLKEDHCFPSQDQVETWWASHNFLKRFDEAKPQTEECSPYNVLLALVNGVHHNHYRCSIGKRKPTSLSELIEWIDKYIGQEESNTTCKDQDFKLVHDDLLDHVWLFIFA